MAMSRRWMVHLPLAALCPLGTACGSSGGGGAFPEARHETVRSLRARAAPSADPGALAAFARGQHALNADLFARLPADLDGQNAMISPLSVQQALGMTWAGAAGETAAQMAEVLRFGEGAHAVQNALAQAILSRALPESASAHGEHFGAVELSMANAVWGRRGLAWKMPFLDTLAENYGAGIETLDFAGAPEASRQFINAWVEAATRDRIRELLPAEAIGAHTALVLTNAVYLKAPWQKAFEPALTEEGDFTRLDGTAVRAPFVHEQALLAYAEGAGWQAVEKQLRGGALRMLFLLPAAGTFADFAAGLDGAALDGVIAAIGAGQAETALYLPKFEFETALSLKAPLESLGMVDAFEERHADFTGMSDGRPLWIGDIFHKTFVALDEEGVEAAAATSVLMADTAMPPLAEVRVFRADRPFFFAIRDAETNAILFFGRVLDPTQR